MHYLFLVLWGITIIAGGIIGTIVPADWVYITGFIAGVASVMFLDLVAAMTSKSNNDMTVAIAQAIAPYALAGDNESVSDVVNKLLRGTSLEQLIDDVNVNV